MSHWCGCVADSFGQAGEEKETSVEDVDDGLENTIRQDQSLILNSSTLLAVCGVGVDESCTVKVKV